MKNIAWLIIAVILFTSCGTSKTISNSKNVPGGARYNKLFTVSINTKKPIYELNETVYNTLIKDSFSDLRRVKFRQQLEKSLDRNFSSPRRSLVKSSEVFKLNTANSYADFINKIDSSGIQALLIVNLTDYWQSKNYTIDGDQASSSAIQNSSAGFNCYLVDMQSKKLVWSARSVVNAPETRIEVLNNTLARQLVAKLTKDGFILDDKDLITAKSGE